MSRYSLRPLAHHADLFEIALGWDSGLGTYFIMVFGIPDVEREPDIRLWRGTTLREITTVNALFAIARGYAEIPDHLAGQLEVDRLASLDDLKRPIHRLLAELLIPGPEHSD